MLDANEVLEPGSKFDDFVQSLEIHDLQEADPANSTFIGTDNRRIDYMLGCTEVLRDTMLQVILSYHQGPMSDHRALFADINTTLLLGENSVNRVAPSKARLLQSGNPESVDQYHRDMHKYYESHKMVERIRDLHKNHARLPIHKVRALLNKWDTDQGRSMIAAETALRSPPQPYQWSDKLRTAGLLRRYWRLRLRECHHSTSYKETFDRIEAQTQVKDPTFELPLRTELLSVTDIRKHLNAATKNLNKRQREAAGLRTQCYYDLLATYESDTDPDTQKESARKAKIVRSTLQGEDCRAYFRQIGNEVKPNHYGGLKKILAPRHIESSNIPDDIHKLLSETDPKDLVWEHVTDSEEMEKFLLSFNHGSFRAAAESPVGHGVVHDAMLFSSLSPASQALLEGEFPPEWQGKNDRLREVLSSFAKPQNVKEAKAMKTEITEKDFEYGIKNWSEKTSTSPSGRHLGHCFLRAGVGLEPQRRHEPVEAQHAEGVVGERHSGIEGGT